MVWLTGTLTDGRFVPRRRGRLDLGDVLYAPQSYATADGRRVMLSWLRINHDPEAVARGWLGAVSVPRELRVVDGRLEQRPSREIDAVSRRLLGRIASSSPSLRLPSPASGLELTVTAREPTALGATSLQLIGEAGQQAVVDLAFVAETRSWSRTSAGWAPDATASTSVRIIIDTGLIEMFTDDGAAAATARLEVTSIVEIGVVTTHDSVGATIAELLR